MGTSVYTSLLIKDFKRKKGDVIALRKELKDLCRVLQRREIEVQALETTIRGREPDFDPTSVKPIASCPKLAGVRWNRLTTAILECLREAAGPVPSDRITAYVIETTGREIAAREDRLVMQNCIKDRLKAMARKGRVVRHHKRGQGGRSFGVWSLPPAPTPPKTLGRRPDDFPASISPS